MKIDSYKTLSKHFKLKLFLKAFNYTYLINLINYTIVTELYLFIITR